MGLQFKEMVESREISFSDLNNKVLAIDSFNMLYQFLSSIRARDGTPLTDQSGNITSHLVGLFSRTTNLMQKNLKLVFVFDGAPPKLKQEERKRRREIKKEAMNEYEVAKERQDIQEMKKYASRTSVLTKEMIDEAKELITSLGLPVIQAPSEGEAQVARIVTNQHANFGVSQDYDTLLYGIPKLVRNLSIAGKRKKAGKLGYDTVKPELIQTTEVLNKLGIDNDQLIVMAMLAGTDYNKGGIKGIGPKNALKLEKQYGKDFDLLFKSVKWGDSYDLDWSDIYYTIKKMRVTDDYSIKFDRYNKEELMTLLCDKHDFSQERIKSSLEKIDKSSPSQNQKGLGEFF